MFRLFRLWRMSRQDLGLLWRALHHPGRPAWLLPVTIMVGLYALDPLNFAMPLLGVVDDLILLPLLLRGIVKLLPLETRLGKQQTLPAR